MKVGQLLFFVIYIVCKKLSLLLSRSFPGKLSGFRIHARLTSSYLGHQASQTLGRFGLAMLRAAELNHIFKLSVSCTSMCVWMQSLFSLPDVLSFTVSDHSCRTIDILCDIEGVCF